MKGDMNFCSTECLGEFLIENTDFSIEYLEDPEGIEADAMEKAMREGVM